MEELIPGVIVGVITGIGWGLLSYGREKQKDQKIEFSPKYFAKTILIGIIAGAYSGYIGMPLEAAIATPVVDKLINIINGFFK